MDGKIKQLVLEREYRKDPELLTHYKKKLLEPGWAGQLTDSEAGYIADTLSKDNRVRGAWTKELRARGYTGRRRRRPSIFVIKMWNDFLVETECQKPHQAS